ncbi:H-2 class I histocompatibility antigen, K-K alpha chain-like isoform X2 [Carassius auratus]|uniref:H-2 class I histocompatibility antigen, K-K alpha chain-like isoform X2 n=1 Tax=Carassius auratus TaxID=7957 RepID=A0A6P6LUX1_CARAU|nr:H-2 class I histocompatibility antigen, K-K alpha chain-like isoform X2 [Carassius auratus]
MCRMFLLFVFIILLFNCFLDAQREKHYIHYKFTALSRADTFPEFSAVAVTDDRQIKHYSNEEGHWILTEDDWINAPEAPPDSRDWFLHQLNTLSNCTDSQCFEPHVLQRVIGCELEMFPEGTVNLRAFDEYGFDRDDFMSFDSDAQQWIEKNPKAKETKMKWDQQTERNQHLKYFLKTCTDWISSFNNTKKSKPDVHTTSRKARNDQNKQVLTCLTTGFYPRDIEMNIRFNKTVLKDHRSSGVRPNDDGSFQMRSSVKISRSQEGIYDCFVNHSSLTKPVEWVIKCTECEESKWPDKVIVAVVVAVVVVVLLAVLLIVLQRYKRRRSNGNYTVTTET